MTDAAGNPAARFRHRVAAVLSSADMARAFTVTALGAAFASSAIIAIAGQVTYITVITGLCMIGAGMLFARRREISLLRLVPTTLIVFLGWALASLFWSSDRGHTITGWLALAALAFLAIVIAHVRDTLQTARAVGDVMRVLLSVSLGLEILSGILLDMPINFLGIQGHLAEGGPVQGIFGTRNLLGLATVLAIITFVIEWRTFSIRTGAAVYSFVVGGVLAALSDSPTVLVLTAAVAAASGALAIVRHTPARSRGVVQWSLGSLVVVGLVIGYAARHPIIAWLGAGSDFAMRVTLWNSLLDYLRNRPINGWGWFGAWSSDDFPFIVINLVTRNHHQSALNAYFDVLLQLGWLGLLLFLTLAGTALVRSWLVASDRRSVVYAWTPLILVALLVDSMFESFTLIGFGWLLLVLCAARAGLSRSWRGRIDFGDDAPLPGGAQGLPNEAG